MNTAPDPFFKICCDRGTAAGTNSMSKGFNVGSSPPATPPFLQVVPAARVVLCLAHGGCYARRNIARHLGEQHHLQRQVEKQALALLEAADITVGLETRHPAHGAEAISGLPLLDGFRCLHLSCGHSSVNVDAIKQHCFQAHGWRRKHQVAPVEEGGNAPTTSPTTTRAYQE